MYAERAPCRLQRDRLVRRFNVRVMLQKHGITNLDVTTIEVNFDWEVSRHEDRRYPHHNAELSL
jgi:hypothetical protein